MLLKTDANSPADTVPALVVATFYKFVRLPDYYTLRARLLTLCRMQRMCGTILLAAEGINGTVAGTRAAIDRLLDFFASDTRLVALEYKETQTTQLPFYRMRVKLKKEIVTMGVAGIDPSQSTGKRLDAATWEQVLTDPKVLVLDVRNQYEHDIGTFKHAVSPNTENFRAFPNYIKRRSDLKRYRKVAMFCTGGIRCEKASAYMLAQGFPEVYQLQGGILGYLKETGAKTDLWRGECFVFDGRVAVDKDLQQGHYQQCFACRMPITEADRRSTHYRQGEYCPHCYDRLTEDQRARFKERQKQVELAAQRGEQHIGATQMGSRT